MVVEVDLHTMSIVRAFRRAFILQFLEGQSGAREAQGTLEEHDMSCRPESSHGDLTEPSKYLRHL